MATDCFPITFYVVYKSLKSLHILYIISECAKITRSWSFGRSDDKLLLSDEKLDRRVITRIYWVQSTGKRGPVAIRNAWLLPQVCTFLLQNHPGVHVGIGIGGDICRVIRRKTYKRRSKFRTAIIIYFTFNNILVHVIIVKYTFLSLYICIYKYTWATEPRGVVVYPS